MTGREKVLLASSGWGLLSTLQWGPGRPHREHPGPEVCVFKAEKPWSGAMLLKLKCGSGLLGIVLEFMRSQRKGKVVTLPPREIG